MSSPDVLSRAVELRAAGSAFVLATVTWCTGPSSGKGGYKAIVHPDGSVDGWLGGACAQPTVVRVALEALRDGEPRLLVLGAPDQRPGVTAVPMSCSSEGAMEVYVEPLLPAPDVWVVGSSPAVSTLLAMLGTLGWRGHAVDGELDVLSGVGAQSSVVVATQGHYDEPALLAALGTPAAYIGLVASQKRAASVLQWLGENGVNDEQLARVRAPAGVDLGRTEHSEIAVSVLAELVALKSSSAAVRPEVAAPPAQAIDPVCGMGVAVASARFVSRTGPAVVYFCSAGCQRAYEADPAR
jgi:xanthine dehydrogenase accessory factor